MSNITRAFYFGVFDLRAVWVMIVWLLALGSARADISIGIAGPMSGQYQSFGEQMVQGAKAAIDDVNSHGGVSGEVLRLTVADDGCDARKTVDAANEFVAAKVAFVIGHFCSSSAIIAAKIYEAAGITMISPAAGLPSFADAAGWNVIRLASRDDVQAEVAAGRINQSFPAGQLAVIDDGAAGNQALVARLIARLARPPVLATVIKPDGDLAGIVQKFTSNAVRIVYIATNPVDAGRLVAGLAQSGITIQVIGPDALLSDEYVTKAGPAGLGTLATFATDPLANRGAKQVTATLKEQGFNSDGPTMASYAAVQLYVAAVLQSGASSSRALAAYLRSGTEINTVLGQLSFDKNGEVQPPRFTWYRWTDKGYSAYQFKN